jgi:lipid A 3-O-deacylase
MKKAALILFVWLATLKCGVAGQLTVGLGAFDVSNSADAMMQAEYDPGVDWAGFRPQLGLFVTQRSSAYLFAGLGYPFQFAERWSLLPSVSAGYYHRGAGKDLGHDLEFYSQLRLSYALSANSAVGVAFAHISNAGLGDENPGANTAYVSYSANF